MLLDVDEDVRLFWTKPLFAPVASDADVLHLPKNLSCQLRAPRSQSHPHGRPQLYNALVLHNIPLPNPPRPIHIHREPVPDLDRQRIIRE